MAKRDGVEKIKNILKDISLDPAEADAFLATNNSAPLPQKQKALQLLLRPNITLNAMIAGLPKIQQALTGFTTDIIEQADIQAHLHNF